MGRHGQTLALERCKTLRLEPRSLPARDASRADASPAALGSDNFAQGSEQAVDFFGGVVVDEADAQEASTLFHVEVLGEVESVIVAVPGEEAAVPKFGG